MTGTVSAVAFPSTIKVHVNELAKVLVPELFVMLDNGIKIVTELKDKLTEQQITITELTKLKEQTNDLVIKFQELSTKYEELSKNSKKLNSLESFCMSKYKLVPNKSYKNKRTYTVVGT